MSGVTKRDGQVALCGTRLRALREARRWKQSQVVLELEAAGRRLGLPVASRGGMKTMNSRWENDWSTPDARYRRMFCLVYGITDAELGNSAPIGGAPGRPRTIESVDTIGMLATLTASSMGAEALAETERVVYALAASYPSLGPAALGQPVTSTFRLIRLALSKPQPIAIRRRTVGLLGVLAGVGGQLAFDLSRADQSAGMYQVGQLASREVEDDDLATWLAATQSIGAFFVGDSFGAVALLDRADELARRASSPRRHAWVAGMRARALAATGRPADALRALDDAHASITRATGPTSGTDFFDETRLEGVAGSTMLLLRDTNEARRLIDSSLRARATSDAKGRALLMLDLAACHVIDGELDEATRLAGDALGIARGFVVGPIIERAGQLRAGMEPWSGTSAVRALDELLRAAA